MKKKIGDLKDNEILEIIGDDWCEYCPYQSKITKDGDVFDCPKRIVISANEPFYPVCFDFEEEVKKEIINNFKDGRLDQEIEVEDENDNTSTRFV